MGKGTIISHQGSGLYSVEIQYDRTGIDAAISELEDYIQACDNVINDAESTETQALYAKARKLSAQKRIDYLQDTDKVPDDETVSAWCTDLTTDLSGNVGTIEIGREPDNGLLIQPGYEDNAVYDADRDGQLVPTMAMKPLANFINLGFLPGMQRWIPTYRTGTITDIDYAADTCDIALTNVSSSQQGLEINRADTLSDVPISYMSCNAAAFETGDEVVVAFSGFDWAGPQVIGFVNNPAACAVLILIVSSQSGDEAFAWNAAADSLFVAKDTLSNVLSSLTDMGFLNEHELVYSGSTYNRWDYDEWYYEGLPNQPLWLRGYLTLDPFDGGWAWSHPWPYTPVYNDGEGNPATHAEWDQYYIENPLDASAPVKGNYVAVYEGVTDSGDSAEFAAETGCEYPDDVTIWHGWWYYSGLFGYNMNDNAVYGDIQASYPWLEQAMEMFLDSWVDVDWICSEDDYGVTDVIRVVHSAGVAENDKGAAVFENLSYCTKWMDGTSECPNGINRKFRVYYHEKDPLTGLALECFNSVNTTRQANGADALVLNPALTAAAEQHLADLIANFAPADFGHTGSDGSSPYERAQTAGYMRWLHSSQAVSIGENIGWNSGYADPVQAAIDNWQASTEGHWEMLINTEMAATGLAYGYIDDSDTSVFVQVFGYRQHAWPEFAPLDTTDLVAYMDANFNWDGTGDEEEQPRVYLM